MTSKRVDPVLYIFLLPCLAYTVIFHYVPLYGLQIAFKDFKASLGIWGSPWTGMENLTRFFSSYSFFDLVKNTLALSVYSLLAGFPAPILLSLILNYTVFPSLKKFTQTITYAPHFISMVVMVGMVQIFFSTTGPINSILGILGQSPRTFMGMPELFRSIYVWSGIWQNSGWASIIYIAVLSGVSPELHEAAMIDGASKLKRIFYIDIPALIPTAVILLILNFGSLMTVGFEKAFLLQNNVNLQVSEVISTYVYKIGILSAQYSYASAVGLFNNVINFILLVAINKAAKTVTETSLW
ncbi:MAG: ABC transporter permease subunit [Treponema sp.]|nr:ABC transporter permease subunit [Treponema sp.]